MRELAAKLPEEVQAKYHAIRDEADDLIAVSRAVGDDMEGVRTQRLKAQTNLQLYLRDPRRTPEHIAALEAEIETHEVEMRRLQRKRDERFERSQSTATLAARIDAFIERTPAKAISLFTGPLKTRGAASPVDAVAAARREIETLRQRLDGIEAAPFPSAEALARVEAIVTALAEAGAPEVDGLLAGETEIVWPTELTLAGERALHTANVPAMLAWLFPDQLCARLAASIEDAADDKHAVATKDRPRLRREIGEAILAASRIEEDAITRAAAAGQFIPRRGDADVRAVLGIVAPDVET